ncbi:lysophospholipase a [Aspergillus udagawae]|uniref:Lysophospholipase a n=1 Tax=Aspergillus udagawae TaxID=91492 RepID=A0A8H3XQP6_9EURO|nr:lysophospholipase a [Aspergillus udagawae]
MIATWNAVLNETARHFSKAHQGTTAMVFDAYSWLTNVFDHAADFGITNTTSFCPEYGNWDIDTNYAAYGCDPIYEYFWYNSGHITYHTHQILATKLNEFLSTKAVCGKTDGGRAVNWGMK